MCFQSGTNLVPIWYEFGTILVYMCTNVVHICYILIWYQSNINLESIWYDLGTNLVRSLYNFIRMSEY